MKFLVETVENVQVDIQESTTGVKDYYITGIFMQSGIKNKNGRIYPADVLAREMNRYSQEQIKTKRSVGELNHPDGPNINLDKVSHMITELWVEGQNIYGKAKILNTPQGQIVKTLIDEGVQLGVSTRGFGSIKDERGVKMVQNDFRLATIDIVQDPSCQSAYVSTLMESKEFFVDDSGNIRERDPSIVIDSIIEDVQGTQGEPVESLIEAYDSEDYKADTELSKFAREHRPKVVSKDGSHTMHLSNYSYPNKDDALEAANIYRNNYNKIHDDRLHDKLTSHWKQKHSVFEDVLLEKFEEALNEISKKTLGSYVKKASKDVETKATNSTSYTAAAERHLDNADRSSDLNLSTAAHSHKKAANQYYKLSDDEAAKVNRRQKGISKAVDKLAEDNNQPHSDIKKLSDKDLIKHLKISRNKDQKRYDKIVTEVETRGIKE